MKYDLRGRINHAHKNTIGTESYERNECANAIESLLGQIDWYENELNSAKLEIEQLSRELPGMWEIADFSGGQTDVCKKWPDRLLVGERKILNMLAGSLSLPMLIEYETKEHFLTDVYSRVGEASSLARQITKVLNA